MDYKEKYEMALEGIQEILSSGEDSISMSRLQLRLQGIFPELKESKDERIRKALLRFHKSTIDIDGIKGEDIIAWLEKQGEIDKASYEIAEKEKREFVGDGFIKCYADFQDFKEGETYWFEYVGNDTYIGRSDNILNKKFHITPRQLYCLFTQQHCPKENNVNEETNAPTEYGKYVDECLNEASKHFFSEGEDKYSVADLFYAGVRCGKSWLEKQGEQKSDDNVETKFKAGDWVVYNYSNTVSPISKIRQIDEGIVELKDTKGSRFQTEIDELNCNYHLWNISDAKEGDVLHSTGFHKDCIFIFNGLDNWKFDEPNGDRAVATGYCCLFVSADKMEFGIQGPDCIEVNTVKPATKIQRDLLFKKMIEAGYVWDENEKELKKIKQTSDDNITPVRKKIIDIIKERVFNLTLKYIDNYCDDHPVRMKENQDKNKEILDEIIMRKQDYDSIMYDDNDLDLNYEYY